MRFLYATGFSGHGFLQGPATARSCAISCSNAPRSSTSRRSRVDRFDGSDLRPELNIV